MGNGNFGISVPEGHIEVLEAAAENITHVAHAADRASGELRNAAKVDGWDGEASKAFTTAVTEGVKPADIAEKELPLAAKAFTELAHALRIARHATQDAVEQARTADRRREDAEHDAKAAQTRLTNRNAEADDLKRVLDSAIARQDHAAEHHVRELLRKVKHDAAEAEHALGDARQRLSKAVAHLEDARHDGERANKHYEAACQRAAKALQAVAAAAPGTAKGDDTALTWKDAYAVMQVGWKVGDKRVSGREVATGLLAVWHAKQRVPAANRGDFWKLVTPQLEAIMKEEKKKPKWKPSRGGKDPGAVVATLGKANFKVGSKGLVIGSGSPLAAVGDPVTGGTPAPQE